MADETDDPTRGLDNAEAGPEESEVKVSVCEEPAQMMEQRAHESGVSFLEEIGEAYQAETIAVALDDEGLPVPMDTGSLATAPPFTYENVVCIEDARHYVEIFAEEFELELPPWVGELQREQGLSFSETLTFLSSGMSPRSRFNRHGEELPRETFEPETVQRRFGILVSGRYPVRPIRPVCEHYKRQIFVNDDAPNPDEPGHKIIFRNCSARRSIGGAALALRDEAVLACEWRSPPDPESVAKHLDSFDNEKLTSNAHKIKLPLFGGGRG